MSTERTGASKCNDGLLPSFHLAVPKAVVLKQCRAMDDARREYFSKDTSVLPKGWSVTAGRRDGYFVQEVKQPFSEASSSSERLGSTVDLLARLTRGVAITEIMRVMKVRASRGIVDTYAATNGASVVWALKESRLACFLPALLKGLEVLRRAFDAENVMACIAIEEEFCNYRILTPMFTSELGRRAITVVQVNIVEQLGKRMVEFIDGFLWENGQGWSNDPEPLTLAVDKIDRLSLTLGFPGERTECLYGELLADYLLS